MFVLGKDSLMFNATFYLERVTPLQCVTTSIKEKAMAFSSIKEAEDFAKSNGLPLYDKDSEESNTVDNFTVFII